MNKAEFESDRRRIFNHVDDDCNQQSDSKGIQSAHHHRVHGLFHNAPHGLRGNLYVLLRGFFQVLVSPAFLIGVVVGLTMMTLVVESVLTDYFSSDEFSAACRQLIESAE